MDGRYAWYVVGVLSIVKLYSTMDQYGLSILADDIRKSFRLSDTDLGFLTGTAFAITYLLSSYPIARLADRWSRVRLLAIALAFWSSMTAISGFATSFGTLSALRLGLGVGEAAVGPAGYSLLSDWFSKTRRATAMGFFGAATYLGAGLSLMIGGLIVSRWNLAYPLLKPFGLEGWRITFLAFGIPGLALALWVATLREPVRGQADEGKRGEQAGRERSFILDLCGILPPLTLYDAARRGPASLLRNIAAALIVALISWGLIEVTHDWMQWSAMGFGAYATFSAFQALRHNDRPTFALTWGTPTFLYAAFGFGVAATVTTLMSIWAAPLAVRSLAMDRGTIGPVLGVITAIGGAAGAILGGKLSDYLLKFTPLARIWVGIGSMLLPIPFTIAMCRTNDPLTYFLCFTPAAIIGKAWIAPGAATIQELVLPRMRATANNVYFTLSLFVSSGLAPYAVGRISEMTHNLGTGLWTTVTAVVVVSAAAMWLCGLGLGRAEASKLERATAAGEGG